MKNKILFLGLSSLIFAASCKKDEDVKPTPVYTQVGVWNGKYGSGSASPSNNYGMVLFSQGSMHAYDGIAGSGSMAVGTYTLFATDSIKGYYQYSGGSSSYYFRGKLNTEKSQINGRWGSDSLALKGGTFYLNK